MEFGKDRRNISPLPASIRPYGIPISVSSPSKSFNTPNEEYAICKSRKAHELSGNQIANLFSNRDPPPQPSFPQDKSYSSQLTEQINQRTEELRKQRLLEREAELKHVARVSEMFSSSQPRRNLTIREKQEEAHRMLRETQEDSRKAFQLFQRRDWEDNQRVLREQEEWSKPITPISTNPTTAGGARPSYFFSSSPGSDKYKALVKSAILSQVPLRSPMHEALRRLLDGHEDELDVVGPIIQDLLHEAEFSTSPLF